MFFINPEFQSKNLKNNVLCLFGRVKKGYFSHTSHLRSKKAISTTRATLTSSISFFLLQPYSKTFTSQSKYFRSYDHTYSVQLGRIPPLFQTIIHYSETSRASKSKFWELFKNLSGNIYTKKFSKILLQWALQG